MCRISPDALHLGVNNAIAHSPPAALHHDHVYGLKHITITLQGPAFERQQVEDLARRNRDQAVFFEQLFLGVVCPRVPAYDRASAVLVWRQKEWTL